MLAAPTVLVAEPTTSNKGELKFENVTSGLPIRLKVNACRPVSTILFPFSRSMVMLTVLAPAWVPVMVAKPVACGPQPAAVSVPGKVQWSLVNVAAEAGAAQMANAPHVRANRRFFTLVALWLVRFRDWLVRFPTGKVGVP